MAINLEDTASPHLESILQTRRWCLAADDHVSGQNRRRPSTTRSFPTAITVTIFTSIRRRTIPQMPPRSFGGVKSAGMRCSPLSSVRYMWTRWRMRARRLWAKLRTA